MRISSLLGLSLFSLLATPIAATEKTTNDGLKIDVTKAVTCDRPTRNGDTVSVHYSGKLAKNDKQFDSSYDRGVPISFKLGAGRVIKGWEEGLLDMCPGEKRTLTIPPDLAYGKRAVGPIPAGSTLIFDTELVAIQGIQREDL
ncbi:Peptidyl-prolyl cis-trans isomerase fpr2 [Ascosphaera atra]|nr:Peptidyl-prolyl cis-trans isomerase fpr2 [Ascosphaera atra]